MTPLHVIGAGGLGREIAAIAKYGVVLFDHHPKSESWRGIPIVSVLPPKSRYILGIGDPATRARLAQQFQDNLPATLVSPHAVVLEADVGAGCFLGPGAVLTVDVELGRHVAVLNNAVVGHDSVVGAFTVICPSATISGRCRVGERCFIGAGATVLPDVTIGDDVTIGAGAVVTRDVPSGSTVKGVPAR